MLCTETVAVRAPDHHGGKDHGGGNRRIPIFALLLLVVSKYPFRCVVRASSPLFTVFGSLFNRNRSEEDAFHGQYKLSQVRKEEQQ